MNFNSPQNRRSLIAIFIILLIVCEITVYVTTTPRPREQFFQLYILGANQIMSNYYPKNNTDIELGDTVTWYVGVTDNMGTVQLVSLRVKISNETPTTIDDQQAESPAPVVTQFIRFLADKETWELPFVWSISNATSTVGNTNILALQINNETYQTQKWSAWKGHNFRIIFELWTWQTDSNAFRFGWVTNGERHVARLQVWFNMTSPLRNPP